MRTFENKLLLALCSLFLTASLSGILALEARAAGYPERPITLIVPYPPGGVTDLTARALAEGMSRHLGQPVVVLNRPGAGATIGGNAVATAAPDGYTLGFFPIAAAVPELFRYYFTAPYSSSDIKAVASISSTAMSFAVRADSPLKSMKDLIELARKNQGVMIGTPGPQTLQAMVMVLMSKKEGVKLDDVPFAGDATMLPALLGGHIPVAALDYSVARASVEAGKLRVLAVCAENRIDLAPDMPTVVELGYEMPFVSALGLFAPKGVPEDLVRTIEQMAAQVTKDPQFVSKMQQISVQIAYKDSAAYRKALARDHHSLETFFKERGLLK